MKKILLFAAACAALVACNISNIDKETPAVDGNAFVKGQRVTLTVGNGIGTKAAGTLSGDDIRFTWTKGDQILVTVEGQGSATFTLKGNGGSASGEFEGEMPGSGTTFSAQYPATEPNLTTQTYDPSHAIASGLMKATATGCTVGSPVELKPEYAVLRLNLYGGAREVSQIVVGSSKSTYTLSISSAVTIGKDKEHATPFFIVLPATESFKSAAVTANAITSTTDNTKSYESYGLGYPISASTTFTATEAKSLTAGSILNMKAVSLTTVWAPVNCGYEPATTSPAYKGYPYGKLYQWGRKDGQGYDSNDATYPSGTNLATGPISDIPTDSDDEKFYKVTASPYNWYSGSSPVANDLWKEDGSSIYDPCPEGWRVPTRAELTELMGSHTSGGLQDGNHGSLTNIKGKYFDGSTAATPTSGVFLPAAGSRFYEDGSALNRGGYGGYWSSSVGGDGARSLDFYDGDVIMSEGGGRALGYSVRCVQE